MGDYREKVALAMIERHEKGECVFGGYILNPDNPTPDAPRNVQEMAEEIKRLNIEVFPYSQERVYSPSESISIHIRPFSRDESSNLAKELSKLH